MSKQVQYDTTGSPEVLHVAEVPDPSPADGQVVVRIQAAGINPFDAKVKAGVIPSQAGFPRVIGNDFTGLVELVGAGAADCHGTPLAAGDAVVGTSPGSVAERVVVDGARLAPRLSAVPAEVAGGLPGPALTASSCLISVPVGPGDTLLVSGASGAVGMLVSQLAVAAGARVIGTAAERNFDLVRGLGAQPVAYGPGLPERVAELGTVTAVIDCHGRDGLDLGHALGLPSERMIGIAAGPAEQELGLRRVDFAGRTPQRLAELLQLVADGKLRLPVAQTFPIQDVVAAFTALESQHAPGKIVVLP